jgi:hypothetical protein
MSGQFSGRQGGGYGNTAPVLSNIVGESRRGSGLHIQLNSPWVNNYWWAFVSLGVIACLVVLCCCVCCCVRKQQKDISSDEPERRVTRGGRRTRKEKRHDADTPSERKAVRAEEGNSDNVESDRVDTERGFQ